MSSLELRQYPSRWFHPRLYNPGREGRNELEEFSPIKRRNCPQPLGLSQQHPTKDTLSTLTRGKYFSIHFCFFVSSLSNSVLTVLWDGTIVKFVTAWCEFVALHQICIILNGVESSLTLIEGHCYNTFTHWL